jgi:hypothetical protein
MTASIPVPDGHDFARNYVRWHFPVACTLLLVLSLAAFSDNLVTDIGQPSNSDPKFVVHGLFLLAWVILLAVQSMLRGLGRLPLHRRLGTWGFGVAAGVTLSTLYLFAAVWKGWAALDPEAMANRILLPCYAACMVAAYRTRRRPELHKRFVYAGTLFLLEPVLARTFDPFVAPLLPAMQPGEDEPIFYGYRVALWTGFYLALLLYDRFRLGRLHPISLGSLAATYAVYAFVMLVGLA